MEKHDRGTGQIYIETVTPAQSMKTADMNNCTGKQAHPKSYRNLGPGCDSLYAMAMRSCTFNIDDRGMPETLPYYDWELMKRIYQRLRDTDTLTFKAWCAFQSAFPGKVKSNYHILIRQQTGELDKLNAFGKRVASLSFDSLTFLCIRNLSITAVNLNTDLLKLTNLAVLVLEQVGAEPRGAADDRMIKNWGASVTETQSFKKLRLLILKHFSISVEALWGLTSFPALALCNLDSWFIKQALRSSRRVGEAYAHPNGRWRQCLIDAKGESSSDKDLETAWTRNDITTHEKMELLYNMASNYLKVPAGEVSHAPIVSIHYGQAKPVVYTTKSSGWFMRTYPSKQMEEEEEAFERENGLEAERRNTSSSNKRRKVREGKARDVGSMLESFGR